MPGSRPTSTNPVVGYLLSPVLVALTTWSLFAIQRVVILSEGTYSRPYAIGFLFPIAVITGRYGARPGFLTLALSTLSTIYVLVEPHFAWLIQRPRDWAEVLGLAVVGSLVIFSSEATRQARERASQLLAESEEARARFRRLSESGMIGIISADFSGNILEANDAFLRMVGYTREEALSGQVCWSEITPPEYRPLDEQAIAQMRASGVCTPWEKEYIRKDGSRVPILIGAAVLEGSRDTAICFVLDLTERKRVEREKARLLTQAQERAEREALVNRIGQAQRASLDPAAVQSVAVRALGQALRADRCYFSTFDLAGDRVQVGQDRHRADLPSLSGEYRISEFGINPEEMYRSGEALVVEDVRTDPVTAAAASAFEALGLRCGVTVPLFDNGRLAATLGVAMADEPRAWSAEEVALVATVAAQTWSTLKAARLLERERNIAVHLQEALTPTRPGRVPGLDLDAHYKAALEEANVGGDFYDVFPVDKGCVALIVGDLSGKGLKAASQVATVRNMLRYALYRSDTIAEAIGELNDILVQHDLLAGFTTLFVGVYDTGSNTLTYVSCGNEPGLLRRAGAGIVEELPPTGPVLGAFPDAAYHAQTLSLFPGDALALYTDGLSEAGRGRHDFLGVAGLAGLLRQSSAGGSAPAIKECIVSGAEAHAQGSLHDDVCLLVAVVQGRN